MIPNLKNIKNISLFNNIRKIKNINYVNFFNNVKKIKNIRREDLTRENFVNLCKMIYNDYIKPFDPLTLSYFPFVGWFIPMTLKYDDEFYKYHAKQSFVLAVYFTFACIFIFCSTVFIPVKADIVQFLFVILIYIHYIVYFTLCYMGTKMIKNGEKGEFPYIKEYISRFTSKIDI